MKSFYKEVFTAEPEQESEEETEKSSTNTSSSAESQPLKKRKKTSKPVKLDNFEEVETDPVDAFLISIGAILKRFSPYHLNLAKTKIFNIVLEHDLQQIEERQSNRSDFSSTSAETLWDANSTSDET